MNVTQVIAAEAFRFVLIRPAVYIPGIVMKLSQRYGFLGLPPADDILHPGTRPLTFSHGKFSGADGIEVLVQTLKVFPQAVSVDTTSSTQVSEAILDDLAEWATSSLNLQIQQINPRRVYLSQLELTLDAQLERCFPTTNPVRQRLMDSLRSYGQEGPMAFQVSSLGLNVDPTKSAVACDFRIERRVNWPYEANTYFSQAPLTTAYHVAVLEEFERVMQAAA